MEYNDARVRALNDRRAAPREYVLYWMQACRRLERNHALERALRFCRDLGRPLVVYEGLRLDYPWASRRLHRFLLEGMQANAARAQALGLNYWPFVETAKGAGRGLLKGLASRACLVLTDDFPGFIVPGQSAALARAIDVPLLAVESSSLVPLARLGPEVSAAAHLRRRIHKAFAEAWPHRSPARLRIDWRSSRRVEAPFETWRTADLASFVEALPLASPLAAVDTAPGGAGAARARLRAFVRQRLRGYAE